MYDKKQKNAETGFFSSLPGCMIKGIFVGAFTGVLFLLISALLIAYTPVSESLSGTLVFACVAISAMFCGMISSKSVKSKGYLKGALGGIIYISLLYILSSVICGKCTFTVHTMLMFFTGIFAGALGGIFGINMQSQ